MKAETPKISEKNAHSFIDLILPQTMGRVFEPIA